ncbi:hypothetical protein BU15DRAFT_73441 [Melanogaster broomeanus]|nr:hypothetical protein BU15DRAFT_73441 [Melanogaster broomeanus]
MSEEILNPNVYLNYLQPGIVGDYEWSRNVDLATLGALIWDILSSLPVDWRFVRTSKPTPVLFAYFSTRICALVVVLLSVLEKTGPVTNCGILMLNLYIFWVVTSSASSYLFLKRVHAVFLLDRLVCHFFTFLWLAAFGASLVVLLGPLREYYEIANTKHCVNHQIEDYVSAAFIVPVIFDAIVFLAITYKILVSHRASTSRTWKAFCSGEALPRLSRAILQSGQQYYMITTGMNVERTIYALSTSSPALTWDILSSLPEDWQIAANKICALVEVLLGILMMTGPITQCGVLVMVLCVFWVIASASSSYLFLTRVHAVFLQDRIVRHFFTFLWLAGFGASFLSLIGPLQDNYEIADTKHCIGSRVADYQSAAFIVSGLFDALVFLAVTYKVLVSYRVSTPRTWRAFWRGEALPRLSRAILQGGQQYYMITAGVNVTRAVVTLLPSASQVLQKQKEIGALDTMLFVYRGSGGVDDGGAVIMVLEGIMSKEIFSPNVYLSYLQPKAASAYEASKTFILSPCVLSLNWRLIRTSKPSLVLFAYFSARIYALAVALLSTSVKTVPICGVIVLNN